MQSLHEFAKLWLSDMRLFSRLVIRRPLRRYQLEIAQAIITSVLHRQGLTFAVMLPRQSGKNETQAQIEAYLLNLYQRVGGQIVKASPTFKPQTQNSIRRLQQALDNDWNKQAAETESGYIVRLGKARALFFSAEPSANVVGATASLLLECDEAQDVEETKWQKDFVPMAASTNATRVLWGTAWTSNTLLARTIAELKKQEALDGVKRVFTIHPDRVADEQPAYGKFLADQVARLGRQHPLVKTQYYLEEIDGSGGLFPPERQALMLGAHAREADGPSPLWAEAIYCFCIDVAGGDEQPTGWQALTQTSPGGRRDSTALTVFRVDLSSLADLRAPIYRVVRRYLWTDVPLANLYGQIKNLAELWRARHVVIDATGIGAGLASFLLRALPRADAVLPFVFTQQSKSKLAWDFLTILDAGRFLDHADDADNAADDDLRRLFHRQLAACEYEILPGPGQIIRWGVPDGKKDAEGEIHDDVLTSAMLCAHLDGLTWSIARPATLIPGRDPLADMDKKDY